MPEYIVRAAGGGWPAIPHHQLADVLDPSGYGFQVVDGPGDLRLALDGCEMVFAAEDVGWQVWFEGETAGHDTDAVVAQVSRQVEEFVAADIEWVRYD